MAEHYGAFVVFVVFPSWDVIVDRMCLEPSPHLQESVPRRLHPSADGGLRVQTDLWRGVSFHFHPSVPSTTLRCPLQSWLMVISHCIQT